MTRLSPTDFFRAALDVLGTQGSDALTISTLCSQLSVTKGSFYHHFGGLSAFVEHLLDYWEAEHNRLLMSRSRAHRGPDRRLAEWVELATDLPHASEAAMRGWGRSRFDVFEVLERVDRRRERHLAELIAGLGVERGQARSVARTFLLVLIGAQLREDPVDVRRLHQALEECTRLVTVASDPRLARRARVIE